MCSTSRYIELTWVYIDKELFRVSYFSWSVHSPTVWNTFVFSVTHLNLRCKRWDTYKLNVNAASKKRITTTSKTKTTLNNNDDDHNKDNEVNHHDDATITTSNNEQKQQQQPTHTQTRNWQQQRQWTSCTLPRAAVVVAISKTNMSLSLSFPVAATVRGLVPRVF